METTKKIFRIDGKDIVAEEKDISQNKLLFYPENPRIKSIIDSEFGENPTQQEIEGKMKSLDSVKELRRSIIANDGLIEPIIVKNNIVIEGNSLLAAYRLLCTTDPIKWGKIRAAVLPDDITEEQIFSLLGTIHIVGKTPWNPFEQAGYLKRRVTTSRKPIEAIAEELGLKRSSAKAYISTFDLMVENDDMDPSKWSYYFELNKNSNILKANKSYPQYDIVENIIERIKNNEFADAREIRKVGNIMKATGDTAEDAIHGYICGDLSLQESLDLIESTSKLENILKKIETLTTTILKDQAYLRENLSDPAVQFGLKNLRLQLNNILGV
ncbi:MAG: hypothetical protein HDS42_05600 [Bacteroides sp.]|nr:hypothetical protein [Bacteroides sp.]